MQPNNNQPSQPLSIDYLDSIAAKPTVKTVNPLMLWGLIGGLLIFTLIVVMALASASGDKTPSASLASIGGRLVDLQKVSEDAQDNIQSTELQSLNSSLTLTLTNTNRDMGEVLKAQKISLKNTKDNKALLIVKKDFDELNQRLEDARLNGVYDRTYAREMAYALKTLHADMGQLYKATRSKNLKTILDDADKSLSLLQSGYEEFNG